MLFTTRSRYNHKYSFTFGMLVHHGYGVNHVIWYLFLLCWDTLENLCGICIVLGSIKKFYMVFV